MTKRTRYALESNDDKFALEGISVSVDLSKDILRENSSEDAVKCSSEADKKT